MNDTKLSMFFDEQLDDIKKWFRDDDLVLAIDRLELLRNLLITRSRQQASDFYHKINNE